MARKTRKTFTLVFAISAFLLDAQARQLRPATILYYTQRLEHFGAFAAQEDTYQLEGLSPTLIRQYLTGLQGCGLSNASLHSAARAVRTQRNFCVAGGFIDVSPMRRVEMPTRDKPQPADLWPAGQGV